MADVRERDPLSPTLAQSLADLSLGPALNTVNLAWPRRDFFDATRDTGVLCDVFASQTDVGLGRPL